MTETKTENLAHALAVLQTRLPEIKKSQEAKIQSDRGKYSYSYADLAQITKELMPILGELGLSFSAKPTILDGQFVLVYTLRHVSGAEDQGIYPLPATGTPQAIGSAITYGRRYCLCAITGIAPEDDDDGAAAQAEAEAERRHDSGSWRSQPARRGGGNDPATQPDLQKIQTLFGRVFITEASERAAFVRSAINRQVNNATELTRQEALEVINALQEHEKKAGTASQPTGPREPTKEEAPHVKAVQNAKTLAQLTTALTAAQKAGVCGNPLRGSHPLDQMFMRKRIDLEKAGRSKNGTPAEPKVPKGAEDKVEDSERFNGPEDGGTEQEGPGPFFEAQYEGECVHGDDIEPGERIRATGAGDFEHEACVEEDEA